jgi:hypothetical protein
MTFLGARWRYRDPRAVSLVCSMLAWSAGNRTSCLPKNSAERQQRKTFPDEEREKHQDSSMPRLPGPAVCRLSEGDETPEALSNCFGTGREHKLNLLRKLVGA